jgi:hypothetical protein
MKEIQHKRKKIQIYRIKYKLPLKPSHRDGKHQFSLSSSKARSVRGLVKISANCPSISMYLISISPFSTWSLKKWCLLSRCLILLWKTGFLATETTLMLSHMRGALSKITSKSLMVCTIHRIWEP